MAISKDEMKKSALTEEEEFQTPVDQELSWDDVDEEELDKAEKDDEFVSEEDTKYPSGIWYNGYNEIVDFKGKKTGEMNAGLFFKKENLPDDFIAALDTAVENEKARQVNVRHKNGDVVEYYQLLAGARFYPLMLGIISPYELRKGDKDKILGITCTDDLYVKRQERTYDFNRNTSCLFIVDVLVEAGYVDGSGLPRPIRLQWSSYDGTGLHKVLSRHSQAVEWCRAHNIFFGKKKKELAEPWMIGFEFRSDVTEERYKKGKKEESSTAVKVEAHIPAPRELTPEYIEKMTAGSELFGQIKKLMYVPIMSNGKVKLLANGPAIKWARIKTERAKARYQQYNPDGRKLDWGKAIPAPTWMIDLMNGEGTPIEIKPDAGLMRTQLENVLIPHFTGKEDEEAAERLTAILNILMNDENIGVEALNRMQADIKKYTDQVMEELKAAENKEMFGEEQDPF